MVTDSFTVPLDAHRALVAKDTRENRQQFMRQEFETVYLGGLTTTEMTDIGNLAKNVFQAQQAVVEQGAGTLTVRATTDKLNAFNATLRQLLDGRSQVLLDVRLIQAGAHQPAQYGRTASAADYGVQRVRGRAVDSEPEPGAGAGDYLVGSGIAGRHAGDSGHSAGVGAGIEFAIFQNGIALFGGGLTLSGVSPAPVTFNLNLNSSESRELDQMQMQLGDGEEGTIKSGSRYPIRHRSFRIWARSGSAFRD